MKGLQKFVNESLSFLDNDWVRVVFFGLIILYIVGVLPMLTRDVLDVFENPLFKLVFLVLIVYIALKDLPLALLLALAFVLSLLLGYKYNVGFHLGPGLSAGINLGAGAKGLPGASLKAEADAETFDFMEKSKEEPEGGNLNHYRDCVKDCATDSTDNLECKGVGVWKDELNAQGLNCPGGFSGTKVGSPL